MTTFTTSTTVEETLQKPEKAVAAVGVSVGVTHTQRKVVLGLCMMWELYGNADGVDRLILMESFDEEEKIKTVVASISDLTDIRTTDRLERIINDR